MDRSVDLIVGLLTILKAGGAYVQALDPGLSEETPGSHAPDSDASVNLSPISLSHRCCRRQRREDNV